MEIYQRKQKKYSIKNLLRRNYQKKNKYKLEMEICI